MNLSAPFIARPVATTLLTFGIALAGCLAFLKLPVSPLPQVDFPTILVQAQLPGASSGYRCSQPGGTARTSPRANCACHGNDLIEQPGPNSHHPPIWH